MMCSRRLVVWQTTTMDVLAIGWRQFPDVRDVRALHRRPSAAMLPRSRSGRAWVALPEEQRDVVVEAVRQDARAMKYAPAWRGPSFVRAAERDRIAGAGASAPVAETRVSPSSSYFTRE